MSIYNYYAQQKKMEATLFNRFVYSNFLHMHVVCMFCNVVFWVDIILVIFFVMFFIVNFFKILNFIILINVLNRTNRYTTLYWQVSCLLIHVCIKYLYKQFSHYFIFFFFRIHWSFSITYTLFSTYSKFFLSILCIPRLFSNNYLFIYLCIYLIIYLPNYLIV